jgi:hypothetical protein
LRVERQQRWHLEEIDGGRILGYRVVFWRFLRRAAMSAGDDHANMDAELIEAVNLEEYPPVRVTFHPPTASHLWKFSSTSWTRRSA